MSSHTPGPYRKIARCWMVHGHREPGFDVQQASGDGLGGFVAENMTEADANLLVAAPELLEACRLALNNGYRMPDQIGRDAGDARIELALRAAIEKATGGAA